MILCVSDQSSCIPIGYLLKLLAVHFPCSRDPKVPRRPSQNHIDVYPLPSLDAMPCHAMLYTAMLYNALGISNCNRLNTLNLIFEHHNLRSQRAQLISVSVSAFALIPSQISHHPRLLGPSPNPPLLGYPALHCARVVCVHRQSGGAGAGGQFLKAPLLDLLPKVLQPARERLAGRAAAERGDAYVSCE